MHFLDIDVDEGKKAQKEFDDKLGIGRAKCVHCDVSKTDDQKVRKINALHARYIDSYVFVTFTQ